MMITNEGSIKIVYFMTPGEGILALGPGHKSYILKNTLFLKKYSSLFWSMTQTDEVHIGDAQSCKFYDSRGRDSCARTWPYKAYIEKKYITSLKIFFSILGHGFDKVYSNFDQGGHCRVSDTQVTVKACGPLVS